MKASSPQKSRQLSGRYGEEIAVIGNNRSVGYAALWLDLLQGVGERSEPDPNQANIVLICGDGDPENYPNASAVIRLWDFQVNRRGTGALASAVSGASIVLGPADGTPLFLPAEMPEKWCGIYGVILALAELWRCRRLSNASVDTADDNTIETRRIYDVSAADILRSFSLQNAGTPDEMQKNWHRNGRFCIDHGGIFPMGFYPCKDGYVALLGRSRRDWRHIRKALGDPEWAQDDRFADPFVLAKDSFEADRLLETTLKQFDRDELLARGLGAGAVIAPVFTAREAEERKIFRDGFLNGATPSLPFLASTMEARENDGSPQTADQKDIVAQQGSPLTGLRCLEFCWVWSGPMVGQILADLGAEVIKIETPARFDLYRTRGLETKRGQMPEATRLESSYQFHSLNRNKIGFTLDLKQRTGVDLAKQLAGCSDLILENFTVGTMDRLGLGSDILAQTNPALTQLSLSGPGKGSSVEELRSYGLVLSALSGAEALIQGPDGFLGSPTFSLSDPNAAAFAAMAALAGVLAAQDNGKGRTLDISQIEAAALLAMSRLQAGSENAAAAQCEWICETIDRGYLAVSLPRRDSNPEPADWCNLTQAEIMQRAQDLGGQAVPVLELPDTETAPEFADCSGWITTCHPISGPENLVAAPWRLNAQRPTPFKTAPLLGEGDDYVLRHVLGLDQAAIDDLVAQGTVSNANTSE